MTKVKSANGHRHGLYSRRFQTPVAGYRRRWRSESVNIAFKWTGGSALRSRKQPSIVPGGYAESVLDYRVVNDLALAARRRPDVVLSHVRACCVCEIGPVAEYVLLRSHTGLPSLATAPPTETLEALRRCLMREDSSERSKMTHVPSVEFARCPAFPDSHEWFAFRERLDIAARSSGLGPQLASGLVGVVGELASNVLEHSGRPRSGFVGYRSSPTGFELVIADQGRGALASLRSCAEHAALSDPGEALRLCIQEGVSRFGTGSGRGFGFRPVFLNMAAQRGHVRIRSDDQAIDFAGDQPTPVTATPTQQARLQGFLVAIRVAGHRA